MPKITIIGVRHGETPDNIKKIISGAVKCADVELTDRGLDQARQTAQTLSKRPVHHLYASDLRRAKQTAEIIAQHVNRQPVYTDLLREIDYGTAEGLDASGLTDAEILAKFGHQFNEDIPAIGARVQKFLALLAQSQNLQDGDTVVVVTHNGFLSGFRTIIGNNGQLTVQKTANAAILEWQLEL
jgi:broad specificity phosphatase PhoE